MAQSAADALSQPVRPNRPALVLLTVAGCVIGLAPVIVMLGRSWLFPVFAVEAAVAALLFVRKLRTAATQPPSRAEYLLGGLGTVTYAGMTGLLFFLSWFVIWEAIRLLALLAGMIGLDWHPNPGTIAFWPSFALAVLWCGVYSYLAVRTLAEQLYPRTAGLRSAFYGLLAPRQGRPLRTYWLAGLLFLGVAVAIAIFGGFRAGFYVFLQLGLFLGASPLSGLGVDVLSLPATGRARAAIRKLLEASGYEVTPSPRTGDPAVDPVLAGVDLLAWNGERTIPVQIKTREQQSADPGKSKAPLAAGQVEWAEASTLRMAATLVGSGGTGLGVPEQVEPLLVLVDLLPADSLLAFAAGQSLRLAVLDAATVDTAFEMVENGELRRLAERTLGLSAPVPEDGAGPAGGQAE